MIDSALLLADLKRVLKSLEADLKVRAEDSSTDWGRRLRDEYDRAKAKERTGLAWIDWRDGEVSQAAVAWIIATVFIRFAEDNGLLAGAELDGRRVSLPWIAAPGDGLERAVENETAFYAASPTMTSRDWLHQAFRTLAALPAGKPLVDPDHSPVWHAPISATASDALLEFFRRTTPDGALVHDFSDPELGTRFLGDLYQDLSEYAKKTYALLQTPVFVEEFILDLTLTPAIAEFGLTGLKLIDPTCGSGHFLLGAFDRLVQAWAATAPNVEVGERVQRALDSIHGVDLNPFAAAIARFRLTVAAIKAAGIKTLVAAPAFRYHLAIGDSLLGGQSVQLGFDLGDGEEFEYSTEDLREHTDILTPGQYHVVVGNPPYIQPPDPQLRDRYRSIYGTASGRYALSVPFMELLFRLARTQAGGAGAGYVGQITSNSFMKREFGKKVIETFLFGGFTGVTPDYIDLSHVIDTARAYIPGHNSEGTGTVIVLGRPRRPTTPAVRAVLGIQGEPSVPPDPANGPVWREIIDHLDRPGFVGRHVSIEDVPRATFASFPWSLSGGGARQVKEHLDQARETTVGSVLSHLGISAVTGEDDFFTLGRTSNATRLGVTITRGLVEGNIVRDWSIGEPDTAIWPYDSDFEVLSLDSIPDRMRQLFWTYKQGINRRRRFGIPMVERGLSWWEWQELYVEKLRSALTLTYPLMGTSGHFALDRSGRVFKNSALVLKLDDSATASDYMKLLGVLNSSTASFWIQEVSQPKQGGTERWDWHFETGSAKLDEFPLPHQRADDVARRLDDLAQARSASLPRAVLPTSGLGGLALARTTWHDSTRQMVALQEELDWQVYAAYGLVDESLAPIDPEIVPIEPNERPFEVRLARAIVDGSEQSAWFTRHGRAPLTTAPSKGSQAWRDLWQARYDAAESGFIKMLERPEYKRRWAGTTWDQLVAEAAVDALLDRLEAPELWRDGRGVPLVRSAAQVADDLRRDDAFRELLTIHLGTQDYDLTAEVGKLLAGDAVPGLAALRYKESGIEKFHEWERTWELQRAEDRGERVDVPVPPKYGQGDFLKTSYWTARGKLDVSKERFISYPGSRLPEDTTELYGWAGWDHAERGQAVARLANDLARSAAPDEQIIPLVGVLLELEPWLKQWHDEIDARSGVSPATAIAGATTALLARLGIGRDQVAAWRPAASKRGRRSAS